MKYPDPEVPKKWHQRSAIFDRRAEAQAWVNEALTEHRNTPGFKPPSAMTLGEFMDEWLESITDRVRPSTLANYRYMARHLASLTSRPIRDIAPLEIQKMYAELQSGGLSARTTFLVHAVLRHALSDAESWGLINANPVLRVKPPRSRRRELRVPTPEEAARLLKATDGHRLHALWVWLAMTGTRKGEALALRWEDLSLQGRSAQALIRSTLSESGSVGPTKTAHGTRTISLPTYLVSILTEHRKLQNLERIAAGPQWVNTGLVFMTGRGTPLSPRNVLRDFKQALAKAGLPETIRVHDLRHAMATHWLASGVPAKLVSERLGHASVSFTLQVYGHVLPGQEAAAAEAMGKDLLGRVTISSPREGENGDA